jgi:cysteine desulfurase
MLLYNLDIHHICASGGSACSSGANVVSHVLEAVYPNNRRVAVRFSFSEENTREEIDVVVEKIKELL